APRSATGVAVMSAVPDTRDRVPEALRGTELSPEGLPVAPGPTPSTAERVGLASTAAADRAAGSGASVGVRRDAPTRATGPPGQTVRLAQHGTLMDGGSDDPAPLAADELALRAALAERVSLEVPPAGGGSWNAPDVQFPEGHGRAGTGGTGPLAAEASTRPPE